MFSSRRLAKRSIIGTRVCCARQDGRYYPCVIQSTDTSYSGDDRFTVMFKDGTTRTIWDKDIIGPGFQGISAVRLEEGQKVFITHNGREVVGEVVEHDFDTDDVCITIQNQSGEDMDVLRRLEDVRLLESRKSARLQDQDTDYSRLADIHAEPAKKRAVSHVIDVPLPAAKLSRRRKSSGSPEVEERMVTEVTNDNDDQDEVMDTMDAHMAAMVLTSLSCSPVSPAFPASFNDQGSTSPGVASSFGSSGIYPGKSGTPSPPQILNGAPTAPLFGTPPIDEGIELDDTHAYFMDDDSSAKRMRPSTRTVFKCTWRGCPGKITNTVSAIEQHVRDEHLGPKDPEDSDLSDHEEEFYYSEVEVSVDTVIETFADMYTSSPPQDVSVIMEASRSDHDYQKKIQYNEPRSSPQNIPSRPQQFDFTAPQGASFPMATEPAQHDFSSSWQVSSTMSPPVKITKTTMSGFNRVVAASPKNSPMHKKSRSDVKKCRKVYGMENRDLWCTQCKWKKACSRFSDGHMSKIF